MRDDPILLLPGAEGMGEKQRCIFIKMDPAVLLHQLSMARRNLRDPAALRCIENMNQAGAIHHGFR